MIIIGIDPGQKGAICILMGEMVLGFVSADVDGLETALAGESRDNIHVFIEAAQAMPGQGVSSMFRYGQGYGELIGALKAFKVPYTCVHPRVWTKEMLQGVPLRFEGKQRAAFRAAQLFPSVDLKNGPRSKKPHEGVVDALLIAEYGRRKIKAV
jgi:hypothetical protein